MTLDVRQTHVFDRMTIRPMADIVQECRQDQKCRIAFMDTVAKLFVAGQFVPTPPMRGDTLPGYVQIAYASRGIDARDQSQLCDLGQPLKCCVSISFRTRSVTGTSISGGTRTSCRYAATISVLLSLETT